MNKNQKWYILSSIGAYSKLGYSLEDSIEAIFLTYNKKNPNYKLLKLIDNDIKHHNINATTSLYNRNVITSIEKLLLESVRNKSKAIKNIQQLQNLNGKFEKNIVNLLIQPIAMLVISTILIFVFQPSIFSFLQEVLIDNNINMTTIEIIEEYRIDWYLANNYNILVFFLVISLIFLFVRYIYQYFYKNDISKVFKIFTIKGYEEMITFLFISKILKDNGRTEYQAMQDIQNLNISKSINTLSKEIELNILASKTISEILKKYNIPIEIINLIKAREINKTLWDDMKSIISFNKDKARIYNKFITNSIKPTAKILSWLIPMYFVFGVLKMIFLISNIVSQSI